MIEIDFETYSEAGYTWDAGENKWQSITSTAPHGIGAVGAPAYAEHPSTDILCLAYGAELWVPGMWPPEELFAHIAAGGLLEAHNSLFEYFIWNYVAVRRYGWPVLPLAQLRCSAAKARAYTIPGKLAEAGRVLGVEHQKIADGDRLIKKFSCPHNPTRTDPRRRIYPDDEPEDAARLYQYCLGDIMAEHDVSAACPALSAEELATWQIDQQINARGVAIDTAAVDSCIRAVERATTRGVIELHEITGGAVRSGSEVARLAAWLTTRGVEVGDLKEETVSTLLAGELPPEARRALELRQALASASVKKLYAIKRRVSGDGRIRDLFSYAGALHTGRWAGKGPQPQNLPAIPVEDIDAALARVAAGDAEPVASCLRGLFIAGPGHDLVCSDYKAIEAVVLAELAGEAWRQDVFRGHGLIYEMSAAKITGTPFIDIVKHKKETGEHHKSRKTGKIAELSSGYQGSVGAWKKFGADKFMSDAEIKNAVDAWRRESPAIVKFWYAMEANAVAAIQNPGQCFEYRGIKLGVARDVLHIGLLSGRHLYYHSPRLRPDVTPWGREVLKISYMGWDSGAATGPKGWNRIDTYGGRLVENCVQAVSRDILAHAMRGLEAAGYPIVLHVHDEIVAEVPEGKGSIEEMEKIMTAMPAWAPTWPVKAVNGWRGKRYRKD
jgi:DNA polymerase